MKNTQCCGFKISNLGLAIIILIFLLVGYMLTYSYQGKSKITSVPNRGNCLADECLMVENLEYPVAELDEAVVGVLNEAIEDEYKALTLYQKVTDKLGMVRPFSMIMGAEEQHIASLKAIFDKYGLEIPKNNWAGKITVPNTLKESCQLGVEAEIANASLYKEKLLPLVSSHEDITLVFTSLMNASEQKHLPAFEKCN
jgi:hypothetical protein